MSGKGAVVEVAVAVARCWGWADGAGMDVAVAGGWGGGAVGLGVPGSAWGLGLPPHADRVTARQRMSTKYQARALRRFIGEGPFWIGSASKMVGL